MSPCMRLYAYLEQQLAPFSFRDHPYRDWIETYSNPEFEQLAQQLEAIGDHYASLTDTVQCNLSLCSFV